MKILIIEDSSKLRRALGVGLRKLGYAVDLVGDGLEGWDYARLNDYDVIVLDLMLPGLDGLGVLRKLRAMGKQTHVLILSAKDQVEDRIRGLQLGADDYMIKPFSFDELCARIGTLLRRRHMAKSPEIVLGSLRHQHRHARGAKPEPADRPDSRGIRDSRTSRPEPGARDVEGPVARRHP